MKSKNPKYLTDSNTLPVRELKIPSVISEVTHRLKPGEILLQSMSLGPTADQENAIHQISTMRTPT